MAWTLNLLIGITIVTAHRYFAYSSSDHEPSHQHDQGTQRLAAARTLDRVSPDIPQPNYSHLDQEDTKKSKVLTSKARLESRRGETSDSSRIVFPGPTSEPLAIEIPEHCKKLGICEDVGNYPLEQVKRAIAENKNLNVLKDDQLDYPVLPDITQRIGPDEENVELCKMREQVVYPKAAQDANGKWHLVLNLDDNPLQGFKVEICDTDGSPCSPIIAEMQSGYEARCIQKFTYRKMAVLHEGTTLEKTLKVPSCCSCVAKLVTLR